MPSGVCADPDTLVATPTGPVAIAQLRAGDLVYSMDRGAMAIVPVLRATSTAVFNHHVLRVELDNGQVLNMSAGHPTADGRLFRDLKVGERLSGAVVRNITEIPYAHARTYDIQPASDTGTYVASGVLIGSTWGGVLASTSASASCDGTKNFSE